MDNNLETPYEEEEQFIECTVCEKSIRGETLFKIHLTTTGHMKKEDGLVAAGLAVRSHHIPVFEDIIQYLEYMKLDEPIIGLNFVEELPCNGQQSGPRYACRLCNQNANIQEMVRHLIGRKHRQKYVELKRPDLITWNKESIITHGGKIIRTRAEIIERQEGRGTPKLMEKKFSRVPPQQKQNRDRNLSQSFTQRDASSHLPELKGYRDEYSHQARYPTGRCHPNAPPFHPEDPFIMNRDRPLYQQDDTFSRDCMEQEPRRADYRESDIREQGYMDSGSRTEYEEECVEDPRRRAVLNPGGVSRNALRKDMLHYQPQDVESYPEGAPPYRPYPKRDTLKECYAEEVRRGQVCSFQHQQTLYPERDEQRTSVDRESARHDGVNRADSQGMSELEAQRRSFPTPMESGWSCHQFNATNDYSYEKREPRQEEAYANAGPSRTGLPASQRRVESTEAMFDIPEPFMRFLKGGANDERHGKRKRKSRFSDATIEEVETTKEMFSDEYGPPNPKFGGCTRPVSAPMRPEIRGTQHADRYIESQSLSHSESYQRGGSESRGVFDMLDNIEIENDEEAHFLKSKLCNLLKEFKTKKSEKAVPHNQGLAAIFKDYNSVNPDPSPRHQFDTNFREDSDLRRQEDFCLKQDQRGRSWQQHAHIPDEGLQEQHHPVRGEPRQSNRSRYEDVFGRPGMSRTPRDSHPNEPANYSERFQEPMHPRDYPPAADEFFNSRAPAPPNHMDRGRRMDQGPRYSNSLDKITCTLLELVARK